MADNYNDRRAPPGSSMDDRRRIAKQNLEERIADNSRMTSEQAHQKAAEVAREADKRANDKQKD